MADLSVLSADYFSVPEEQIKAIESVLTIIGGKVVYAVEDFSPLAPPPLPVSPDWSPVAKFGGYAKADVKSVARQEHYPVHTCAEHSLADNFRHHARSQMGSASELWTPGCDCFAI